MFMLSPDHEKFVSHRTQAIFQVLASAGTDIAGLLTLISSAYADGGDYVLDQLHERMTADAGD
jgi:hypothetical protein